MVDGTDHVGRAGVERMERAVPQAQSGRGFPLRLVPALGKDLAGQGQGPLGPQAAQAQPLPLAGPVLGAPQPGDPRRRVQGVLP